MRNEIQVAGQQTGIKLRPYEHHAKYYETDQMGIIHHSNYVKWMEEARMDLMDQMGLSCFLNRSGKPISLKRSYPELDTKFFEMKEDMQ